MRPCGCRAPFGAAADHDPRCVEAEGCRGSGFRLASRTSSGRRAWSAPAAIAGGDRLIDQFVTLFGPQWMLAQGRQSRPSRPDPHRCRHSGPGSRRFEALATWFGLRDPRVRSRAGADGETSTKSRPVGEAIGGEKPDSLTLDHQFDPDGQLFKLQGEGAVGHHVG